MRLDNKPFESEKRSPTVFGSIKTLQSLFQCRFYQKCSNLALHGIHHSFFYFVDQLRADTFIKFENDISDKSFADNNVCIAGWNIPCFNTSDKVDSLCFFKKREGLFDKCIAFFFFCTIIDNRNTWIFDSYNMLHIDGTHFCKLYQMRWSCIYICSTVNQKRDSLGGRNQRGKRWSLNAFASAHQHLPAYKNCSGTSGRNKCICFLFFDHFQPDNDGRIFLLTDCKYRRFCCFDYFCCIYHLNPVCRIILVFLKF